VSARKNWILVSAPVAALILAASCGDGEADGGSPPKSDSGAYPVPGPGELCLYPPEPGNVAVYALPERVAIAPGNTREVDVLVVPDVCVPEKLSFESDDENVVAAPAAEQLDLTRARVTLKLTGKAEGSATITARFPRGDGTDAEKKISVEVMNADLAKCSGSGSGKLDDGAAVNGSGALAGASIGLQTGATKPNKGSFLWSVAPFDVTLECGADQIPAGFTALGPAVTFGPETTKLQREVLFSLPVNPARMPDTARLRHVTVSYTGPSAKEPRTIPITNPKIDKGSNGWTLSFLAPWLGTYQAVVQTDGGTVSRKRRLTHRALIGISMGGGGTATFGTRFHQRFDVLAPLGGPVDWTYLLGHIEKNHLGGFLPNDGTTPPATLAPRPEPTLPYEHTQTFNEWWYEYPKTGNGGSFDRAEYVQIFRDLALMFGNPNGYNPAPGAENLPAGIDPNDKSVVGDRSNRECAVWVDPIDSDPDVAKQKELANTCPAERCKHTAVLSNYYDDEFNPNGTFPVITVCDGSPQDKALSPYANTWSASGNDKPLELALAVDYNNNGIRDREEPIIRQGHEPYEDTGMDGKSSAQEAGYVAGVNDDPAGDDWHPQYNPLGTEGNYRWDEGEPFSDFGLDGVDKTVSSPYDFGEGNGKFDYSAGYRTFLERDSRTVIEQHPWGTHEKPMDDAAFHRLDMWTDGGTRDLFNFAVDAQALAGAWAGRGRIVHYYHETQHIPGQDPNDPVSFVAGLNNWADIPGGVLLRYGKNDPSDKDIEQGSGQHVGTATEIARRLQSALYYIGSRWPNAPRTFDEAGAIEPAPGAPNCEIVGACDFDFTDSLGRKGPVSVTLPPGYAHVGAQAKKYPVIYLLHGYGQTPEDLKAAIIFLANWMNFGGDSTATRLPKAIMVYVDGRCRSGPDEAECIRGTFYANSVRKSGPKIETWFSELMDEIDKKYRVMPEQEIDWVE
jgi:hypothetical protein